MVHSESALSKRKEWTADWLEVPRRPNPPRAGLIRDQGRFVQMRKSGVSKYILFFPSCFLIP